MIFQVRLKTYPMERSSDHNNMGMSSIIETKIQKYKLKGINYLMNCIKIASKSLNFEEVI